MKAPYRGLATTLCIAISATLFAGTAVTPVYANSTSAMSQGLAYEDAEVSALLDQMAAEFEAQYQNDPVSFDQALAGLDRSFSAQPTLGVVAPNASWESYARCVGNGIAVAFGLDILKRAVNKPVIDALKSRQWRVASSIIHTNLSRILGAKGASLVIKKMENKLLPGGLPGQIVWIAAKCGVKEFI